MVSSLVLLDLCGELMSIIKIILIPPILLILAVHLASFLAVHRGIASIWMAE